MVSLADQYNVREGERGYQGPPRLSFLDLLGLGLYNLAPGNNVSSDRAPQNPLSLWGVEKPVSKMPIGEAVSPIRANYEMIRQYNPYIADQYAADELRKQQGEKWLGLSKNEIQQLINYGNIQ